MMLFGGRPDPSKSARNDNLPQSFHKYEMCQATDEDFILEVLKDFVSYETAINIKTSVEKRSLAKYARISKQYPPKIATHQEYRAVLELYGLTEALADKLLLQ